MHKRKCQSCMGTQSLDLGKMSPTTYLKREFALHGGGHVEQDVPNVMHLPRSRRDVRELWPIHKRKCQCCVSRCMDNSHQQR